MQIREIMSADATVIAPATSLADAAVQMRDRDVGMLPVGDSDRLVGMVTDRDIALRGVGGNKGVDTPVSGIMSEDVYYCFDDADIEEAARSMARLQVRRLPVVDRDKRLVGVVALTDLARADAAMLSAAVGSVSEPTEAARL